MFESSEQGRNVSSTRRGNQTSRVYQLAKTHTVDLGLVGGKCILDVAQNIMVPMRECLGPLAAWMLSSGVVVLSF